MDKSILTVTEHTHTHTRARIVRRIAVPQNYVRIEYFPSVVYESRAFTKNISTITLTLLKRCHCNSPYIYYTNINFTNSLSENIVLQAEYRKFYQQILLMRRNFQWENTYVHIFLKRSSNAHIISFDYCKKVLSSYYIIVFKNRRHRCSSREHPPNATFEIM